MSLNIMWDNYFLNESQSTKLNFLKSISLFQKLQLKELSILERTLHIRKYKKDEVIFNENEPGAALYIIEQGKVEIFKSYDSNPILLTTLEEGMFFGELALFDEKPRSATVIATNDCTLIALSKPDFMLFCKKEAKIGNKIIMELGKILSSRLRVANEQIEELKYSDV